MSQFSWMSQSMFVPLYSSSWCFRADIWQVMHTHWNTSLQKFSRTRCVNANPFPTHTPLLTRAQSNQPKGNNLQWSIVVWIRSIDSFHIRPIEMHSCRCDNMQVWGKYHQSIYKNITFFPPAWTDQKKKNSRTRQGHQSDP